MNRSKIVESIVANALRVFVTFTESEISALRGIESRPQRVGKGADLVYPGQRQSTPFVVVEGYVLEYLQDAAGHRQALEILLPGDIANLRSVVLSSTDIHMTARVDSVISRFSAKEFYRLIADYPRLGAVVVWRAAVGRSMLAEHLLDVGRLNAYQRLGHLLLELLVRMKWAGLTTDETLSTPFDLRTLGDMVGLSHEHTSRTLGKLRRDGLVELNDGRIKILDRTRLADISEFDQSYLHPEGWPEDLGAHYS